MHRARIPEYSKVKASVKEWFFPTILVAEKLRIAIVGALITIIVSEVSAYRLLKQNVVSGDLPPYTTDLLIMLLGVLEAAVSPFVGLIGYRWRRVVMVATCLVAGTISLLWLALPDVNVNESVGYCNGNNTLTVINNNTSQVAVRLTIILFTFVVFGLTRILLWCHGIAYIDEHSPSRLGMHYGLLSVFRLLGLVMGYNILTDMLEKNMLVQTLLISIGLVVNAIQVFMNVPRVPPLREEPKGPVDDDLSETSLFVPKVASSNEIGVLRSLYRVFSNTLVMSQMVAMGLVAAGLWGLAYHQSEYLKAKFYLNEERNSSMNNAEILRNHAVVLAVAYMGLKFTPPIMGYVVKTKVLIQVARMCVFSIILYILAMFAVNCEDGSIAGLDERYTQPQCSRSCGCSPQWQEFSPVCVVEQMTTYLSPCHAGCSAVEDISGLTVFSNCTCAPLSGRAISGSCNSNNCNGAIQFHQMLYALLLSVSALAFQAQGVVILRAANPDDRTTVLGLAGAVVAIFTFVCGHLVFLGVTIGSCSWYEGGRCHLHSKKYPYLIGGISAGMVLIAFIITVTNIVNLKMAERRSKREADERDEDQY